VPKVEIQTHAEVDGANAESGNIWRALFSLIKFFHNNGTFRTHLILLYTTERNRPKVVINILCSVFLPN
jgi:hypothetical protein